MYFLKKNFKTKKKKKMLGKKSNKFHVGNNIEFEIYKNVDILGELLWKNSK